MSRKANAFLLLAAILSVAQLFPQTVRDNPPTRAEIAAPPDVHRILRRSCYDCHSNETRWPWYSHVAPASWLVTEDVRDARSRMNFSKWPHSASPDVECYFKRHIWERTASGEMPPLRYRLLHPTSGVTAEELGLLEQWAMLGCDRED